MKDQNYLSLMWAIQTLSLPYEQQLSLYPAQADVPDEIMIDYEQALRLFNRFNGADHLHSHEKDALDSLDAYIIAISDLEDPEIWTLESMKDSSEWSEVRRLAEAFLSLMDWTGVPPSSAERGAFYIFKKTDDLD